MNTVVVIDKKGFAEHYDVECQNLVTDVLRVFRKYYTSNVKMMTIVSDNSWHLFECKPLTNGYWELTVSTRYNCHQTHVCNFKM